jgi:hypothetical protein
MEKLVRVISQGAPQSRQWTNPNTGEMKTITSVEVEMTDGLDRFIAEASDDLANQLATGCTSRYARKTTADTSASCRSADRPPLSPPFKGRGQGWGLDSAMPLARQELLSVKKILTPPPSPPLQGSGDRRPPPSRLRPTVATLPNCSLLARLRPTVATLPNRSLLAIAYKGGESGGHPCRGCSTF